MVTFDAAVDGTSAATWDADPRMHDRPRLSLDGIDELLVVAAHPDDETLGAGGLIAECVRRGIPATIMVVTDGGASGEPGIVERRADEARAAARALGADVVLLGLPDGSTRERRDEVRDALAPAIEHASRRALVVAPWQGDGHRDHRVVGEVVGELVGSRRFIQYPIWLWHWGDPGRGDLPWHDVVSLPVLGDRKVRALAEYTSQTSGHDPLLRSGFMANFSRAAEYFIEQRPTLGQAYFDDTYARRDDPWGFESRWYEERKRALTLAILPDEHYGTGFEVGCSIGVLTEGLASRVTDLLAVDISPAAVERARQRVPSVRIEQLDVADTVPAGPFELIVLSEVGYYFDHPTLVSVLERISAALAPGGTLVACHWRHHVEDYPLDGDRVHEAIRDLGLDRLAMHFEKDFVLEVFSNDPRSVAERTGLA